jgi:(1->4)-alpha-D-glucan 1-alpha-D-glucosylmutase
MTASRDPRIPGATYRIQLTKDFTFRHARELVDYWRALGVTDLYTAPFFKARPGSIHGYDVVDPGVINPEIGTEDDLARLHEALEKREMGLLMDVVPNHMCVSTNDNVWWNDVLENGHRSPYAHYFDIDWRPAKAELRDKVLLPILANQYGKELEGGELTVGESDGRLSVHYHDKRLPIRLSTYSLVLEGALSRLRQRIDHDKSTAGELADLIAAARQLPGSLALSPGAASANRSAETVPLQDRLRGLLEQSTAVRQALDEELGALNGKKGDPHSFDRLEQLLAGQAYRLSFWRVAAEQINYRRFFEINDLAAIRIEQREVLEAVHAKAFELLSRGWITGLRIDHVDGLREPRRYLKELAERTAGTYVVVEKILASDERLPRPWITEGTTGYEFLNILNGLFVARSGEKPLRALYDSLRTVTGTFGDVVRDSKRLILQTAMSSELSVLTRRLDRISEQHRWSRDFTLGTLQQVLAETIACFPVYRTYLSEGETDIAPQDLLHIRTAIGLAKRHNPAIDPSAFDFLADVLLMHDPDGLTDTQKSDRRDFVLRFQQLTGPVMAKGLEDTTFYRYFPLLSLNEVGGGPSRFGISVEEFHHLMEDRARERPGSLSGTSTHDTKRGEDSRTRLDVLSEIPEEWTAAVAEWRELATSSKPKVEGVLCPDTDDEYYIYQTLVGAWPSGALDDESLTIFASRLRGAIEKALREAKRNTSWISPNEPYEEATHTFVGRLLDPKGVLYPKLCAFVGRITRPAQLTSLAQLVVKLTAPGVPDFYQGTELWDLSLVDPDNRRAIDYAARRRHLEELTKRIEAAGSRAPVLADLWRTVDDGRIKMFVTEALLACRRSEADLFARGGYLPLEVVGPRRDNVVAFARIWQRRLVLTVTGRFFTQLDGTEAIPRPRIWAETEIIVPAEYSGGEVTDALTGAKYAIPAGTLRLSELFEHMPFAVLTGDIGAPQRAA